MKFIPSRRYKKMSDIDFKGLYKKGTRGLLFDIDNTLVKDEAPVDAECIKFFDKLKSIGFKCCIISNNGKKRVKTFSNKCKVPYVYKVLKPKKDGYEKALKKIGVEKENTVMIGDQILTDILGANNADIKSFLVDPIDTNNERFHIKLKRLIESIIILFNKKDFKYYI